MPIVGKPRSPYEENDHYEDMYGGNREVWPHEESECERKYREREERDFFHERVAKYVIEYGNDCERPTEEPLWEKIYSFGGSLRLWKLGTDLIAYQNIDSGQPPKIKTLEVGYVPEPQRTRIGI